LWPQRERRLVAADQRLEESVSMDKTRYGFITDINVAKWSSLVGLAAGESARNGSAAVTSRGAK